MARSMLSARMQIGCVLVLVGAAGCAEEGAILEPHPGTAGAAQLHAEPPDGPDEGAGEDGPGAALAVSRVRLGGADRVGAPQPEAWKDIGLDLDGVVTADAQHATCAAAAGATFRGAHEDGHGGRDNAFGKSILPMIQVLAGAAERRTNQDIARGWYTMIIAIDGMGDRPEYDGLSARLYDGAPLGRRVPAFDGDDVWPPTFESLRNGDVTKPIAPIHDSYVADTGAGGTWVGRSEGQLTFHVAMSPGADRDKVVRLTVHRPIVAVRFSEDRRTATGTLAGYLRPSEVHAEIRRVMALYHAGACHGEGVDGVKHQIEKAADILEGGSVAPDSPCDAISFGIELAAARVTLGRPAPPAEPPRNPCR